MKKYLSMLCLCFGVFLCSCGDIDKTISEAKDYTQFVNVFIGTGGHGHTFPGATTPHGMVQLSPDTRTTGWDACGGYHYTDDTVLGFSHTHLSGTGISDYGDILMMPITYSPGEDSLWQDYRSKFSHEHEEGSPGYYQVFLESYQVNAELTTTSRAGFHRYTYPKGMEKALVLDLSHHIYDQTNKDLVVEVLDATTIRGLKRTAGWANDQVIYFYAQFSQPFQYELVDDNHTVSGTNKLQGNNVKAVLKFDEEESSTILVKIGISVVDIEGAQKNLSHEISNWDFDHVRQEAQSTWNRQLGKIDVETNNHKHKTIFYTSLYHALISPNIHSDVDGRYLGMDHQIYTSKSRNQYTVFSLWDTFRALHPLMTIVDPKLDADLINTLVDKYDKGGVLPKWELSSNYTNTMIGYHAVPVIVDAYVKGIRDFDVEKAYEACLSTSLYDTSDMSKVYKNTLGYIPSDKVHESVAKGLAYAYDDWCIAQFSKELEKEDDYERFMTLSNSYKRYYDTKSGFMRGKLSDSTWRHPFDPKASNHRSDDYCEGNAWQWSWFVPHDVSGLIQLMGGEAAFIVKLDSLFSIDSVIAGDNVSADITGLIGQYAHGNEPSHHITHLYNYVGQSWKAQTLVDQVLNTLYFNEPNGLAGNEDCGQMSAWYVLNAMGFYSFLPGSTNYTVGRPLFDKVTIKLDNGLEFKITAINNSERNKYIQSASLNGEDMNVPFLSHNALTTSGELIFEMGSTPNKQWNKK